MKNGGNLHVSKRKTPEKKAGYDLDHRGNGGFSLMKKFLLTYANDIQKKATEHHKEYLGGESFRSEYIDKYQKNHIKIVEEIAANLQAGDIKKGSLIFKKIGEKVGKESVKDGLTLKEAIDGIIFLKQAIWQKMESHGILDILSVKDFYQISHAMGTYCDVVATKLSFAYHENYLHNVEKAIKTRDSFISAASHELKTPITSLKIFSQGLRRKIETSEEKSVLLKVTDKMDSQINRLTALVEDLLSVSKIQHGKLEFTMIPFDLNALVIEVVEAIGGISTQHKLIIKGKIKKQVFGDKQRLYQVLTNLITNAIKYSPEAHEVIVGLTEKQTEAIVAVQDFGIGISPAEQKKIFDEFYRVHEKGEPTFAGMGMGLFISSEIVRRHGGRITIKSEEGKGSTFYFTLPIVPLT